MVARRVLLVALVAALVAACTGTSPTPSTQPPGRDPGIVVQEPLPTGPVDFTVLAATQNAIWASFSAPAALSGDRVSLDGGATWQPGINQYSIGRATGSAGRFGYVATSDELPIPYLMNPAEPTAAKALRWEDDGSHYLAVGVGAALSSNFTLATLKGRRTVAFPALPAAASDPRHSYAFTGDAALALQITRTGGADDYVAMVDVRTGRKAGMLTLPRSSVHQAAGSDLYSLFADGQGLALCRQPLPSGRPSCQPVATGDHRGIHPRLYQFGASSVIHDPLSLHPLLVEDGRVTPVVLPAGTTSWRGEGNGDPSRPLLRIVDAAGEPHHVRVAADGSTAEWLAVPRVPHTPFALAITPTRCWAPGTATSARGCAPSPTTNCSLPRGYRARASTARPDHGG